MMKGILSIIFLLLCSSGFLVAQENIDDWITPYEQSEFLETPRYAETISYFIRLANHAPFLTYSTFGKSPQGRDLPLLIADKDGLLDPDSIRQSGRLIILIQACIHAGESDGKDAGMLLLRDMAIKGEHMSLLDSISIMFIPIYNVDGHERFGPFNRINQNGPEEMGWRTNATSLNLNRDYLKADAQETVAWLKLWNAWDPDFFIDIHTTNGADYQYAITYQMEIHGNLYSPLSTWCKENFIPKMLKQMDDAGILMHEYISFRKWTDPNSGISSYVSPPRLSTGYVALRNRPGLLVETHMLKDYKTRVDATYQLLIETLEILKDQKDSLEFLNADADFFTASSVFRDDAYTLSYKASEEYEDVDFLGYNMIQVKSDITGSTYTAYGDEPQLLKFKYYNEVLPDVQLVLPSAYIIPPQWTEVIDRLEIHGVEYRQLGTPMTIYSESYRLLEPNWRRSPYEGRITVQVATGSINGPMHFPQGSIVVPMLQKNARIAAHILEPRAPDSYVFWGFFNSVMEQKEYAEFYVMEPIAAKMLQEDAALREEYEEKMKDESFANNPWAILNWFYSKTLYWDTQKNLYPIGRVFQGVP